VAATPGGFSIGYVSHKTGLTTHVIRAWERRYQAVRPKRTQSGRRIFTESDIERLNLFKRLLEEGHSISTIAGLDQEKLIELTGGTMHNQSPPSTGFSADASPAACEPDALVDVCLDAVRLLDGNRLYQRLQEGMLQLSRQALLETVVRPLMTRVGHEWVEGTMRIVHGHLAAVVVHAVLNGMLTTCLGEGDEKPCMLVATPAGQRCYLGAQAVAIIAQDHGWKPALLGFNLPAEEIAAACTIIQPQLVALSITSRVDDAFTNNELKRLCQMIDGRCSIIIGGQASHFYRRHIDSLGCGICSTAKAMMRQLH
jgi:MerR family transcriptional regulator, light-induced transcriptional regulator